MCSSPFLFLLLCPMIHMLPLSRCLSLQKSFIQGRCWYACRACFRLWENGWVPGAQVCCRLSDHKCLGNQNMHVPGLWWALGGQVAHRWIWVGQLRDRTSGLIHAIGSMCNHFDLFKAWLEVFTLCVHPYSPAPQPLTSPSSLSAPNTYHPVWTMSGLSFLRPHCPHFPFPLLLASSASLAVSPSAMGWVSRFTLVLSLLFQSTHTFFCVWDAGALPWLSARHLG